MDNHTKKNWLCCVLLCVFLLAESWFTVMVVSELLGDFIDATLKYHYDALIDISIKFFSAIVILAIIMFINKTLGFMLQRNLNLQYELIFFEKVKNFKQLQLKDPIPVLRDMVVRLSKNKIDLFVGLMKDGCCLLIGCIYVYLKEPMVLIFTIMITLIMIAVTRKKVNIVKQLSQQFESINKEIYEHTWEHLYNQEILPFLNEERVFHKYDKMNQEFLHTLITLKKSGNSVQSFSMIGTNALIALTVVISGFFYAKGIVEISSIYSLIIVVPLVSNSLFRFPNYLLDYTKMRELENLVLEYYHTDYDEITQDILIPAPIGELLINIKQLGYADQNPLIENVHFSAKLGEFIAIMGESGCGKSTLIRNVAKLICNYEGSITINGIDIGNIPRKQYWKYLSYMDQMPRMIAGTIEDNIVLGSMEEINLLRLDQALVGSGVKDIINKLPNGIHSAITTLSSGEKQKVCFARIFYQNRPIWILDEATSALDEKSEAFILDYLINNFGQEKLIICVTHRQNFRNRATRVFLVKNKQFHHVVYEEGMIE